MDEQLQNLKLRVNEIFGPTIQGEGASTGKPVVFLRLSGCNLACSWCDTPYTWNWVGSKFVHPDKFDPKTEMHMMLVGDVFRKLEELGSTVKAVVISGGEPFLQQEALTLLLTILKDQGYWVEIETNGTQEPTDTFLDLVDQINCSPKLANSGPDNPLEKRRIDSALQKLAKSKKTHFKFVVTNDNDLVEIEELIKKYEMKSVYLMPEGRTKDEQEARQTKVVDLCTKYGFKFSPRQHILIWGTKRGV